MAQLVGDPLLAQFQIDPKLAWHCDEGDIERYDSEILNNFVETFLQMMSIRAK